MSRDDDFRVLVVQIAAAQRTASDLKLPVLHHILSMAMLESFQDNRPPLKASFPVTNQRRTVKSQVLIEISSRAAETAVFLAVSIQSIGWL